MLVVLTVTLTHILLLEAVVPVLLVVMVQVMQVVMVVLEHRFQQPSEIQQDQVLLETLGD